MDCRERFVEENELLKDRRSLSKERLSCITKESTVKEPYQDYFQKTASFLLYLHDLFDEINETELKEVSLERLHSINESLYQDIVGEHYQKSYANPAVAVERLGLDYGGMLCFLYAQIRSVIGSVFERQAFPLVIHSELLIETYHCFEESVTPKQIKDIIYWHISDYSDDMMERRIAEQLDVTMSFAKDLIMESDLNDLRYLYCFGEYITENELKIAKHLNALPQREIERLASVFTEGYRLGFLKAKKDLSKKKIVNIRYHLGFERIVRQAILNFQDMGLQPSIYRASISSVHNYIGYEGAAANRQFLYDHRNDRALYLDRAYLERRLGALKTAYEKYKNEAAVFAGPAVMEVFGETPFAPASKPESYALSAKQQKLAVELSNASSMLVNQYIPGNERSFTIIAFPLPEIGEPFAEIFNKIVEINTLDYKKYQKIQQIMIDALDQGAYVHVEGMNGNKTQLDVSLQPLSEPEKQTLFENCVADVNIPVGEAFTSPQLKGTTGCLHVTNVFLNDLEYKDLELQFCDGMVIAYTCANFENEEENRRYVKENVLHHHKTLPIGEFAIGTNTTAYVVAQRYQLAAKMPILIAEKMGPHFAVGDTCYSWQEDEPVYNPDGKEVIARDNECSILRKEDVSKAYFNCHTDITIPYNELGSLFVMTKTNERIDIINNGRFVLPGTESLNEAFE